MGAIASIYVRDPDGNLIEVSNYLENSTWKFYTPSSYTSNHP
jgi:catechol-2,3-dioxygenase